MEYLSREKPYGYKDDEEGPSDISLPIFGIDHIKPQRQHHNLLPRRKSIRSRSPLSCMAKLVMLTAISASCILLYTKVLNSDELPPSIANLPGHYYGTHNHQTTNRTLDFQKIFIVNIPKRTDKRAEMSLLAHTYGYDITFSQGFDGHVERPDLPKINRGQWGCAQAHAKIWETMIHEDIQTALVMEDDADHSEYLREQLMLLKDPLKDFLQALNVTNGNFSPKDPYHSKHWDYLWLGHQFQRPWKIEDYPLPPYLTYDDPHNIELDSLTDEFTNLFESYELNARYSRSGGFRLLQPAKYSYGTVGYAISLSGAKKVLYNYVHRPDVTHIDDTMTDLAAQDKRFRTYSVNPPLFQQRVSSEGADSDREGAHHPIGGEKGYTQNIYRSARRSLRESVFSQTVNRTAPLHTFGH